MTTSFVRLLDNPRDDARCVMLTGATGYVGSLIAAALLARTTSKVIAPVRDKHALEDIRASIAGELVALGAEASLVDDADRFVVVQLPPREALSELAEALRAHGVTEIVHSAGSVDYFNAKTLQEVNVELTRALLALGRAIEIKRFVFISTAFSSGYTQRPIEETLHAEPDEDPTEYTCSKRVAEREVAESGLPYLILRPSIVVGHSRTGRYKGRPYGIYQFLNAMDRLLVGHSLDAFHVVAPARELPMVHQDAFQDGFIGALRYLADNSVMHLVSDQPQLPTMRDMVDILLTDTAYFREVSDLHIYDSLTDVPMKQLTKRMRTWVEFSAVNTEIATNMWDFQMPTLAALRERGLVKTQDADRESLRACIRGWVAHNEKLAERASFTGRVLYAQRQSA
jgi:nucleoside-diphosphate-sugar epimerase